ncbi:MAG: YicC/YloC family endoribonuclease [Bacteroidota bacterium]
MLESMTGFGRGTARVEQTEVTVELRSVNGRFCEVTVRGPRALGAYEDQIRNGLRDRLQRGKVTASITLQQATTEAPLKVNVAAAQGYAALLRDLHQATGLDAPITLDQLLRFNDVLVPDESDAADETAWAATQQALEDAAAALEAMRRREGEALRVDLAARADVIEAELQAVEVRAPQRVGEHQATLRTRLAELLADDRLNPDRLETEIAILADKLDVTEECVRLHSHLAGFRAALASDEAVGRRLNFLAQEFNREINTIASKANDAEMAARAVTMKEELEKIREQVQNVV